MKGLFPQFAGSSEIDYRSVWEHAHFAFDTNVLLNLYRYRLTTRDELLNVMTKLADRIWIPHQVALEFQRNRLEVIADQNKRFLDVRRAIDKAKVGLNNELHNLQLLTRHSQIDPKPLTDGFDTLANEFLTSLAGLEATQQQLTAPDPLKATIEALFDGRVGMPPPDQQSVSELYKVAEDRFKLKIPPGYEDTDKDTKAPDEYTSGGIIYKRKYGDFLLWRQLLSHAKTRGWTSVILVTDDGKNDWWWKVSSDGLKTIGPRPELIEEAKLTGGIETLLMYRPEGFLTYAKDFLKARVSDETLKEVRYVSTPKFISEPKTVSLAAGSRAQRAVLRWLKGISDGVIEENGSGFPDFIVHSNEGRIGFEVKIFRRADKVRPLLNHTLYRAYHAISEGRVDAIKIVLILDNIDDADKCRRNLLGRRYQSMPDSLRIIVGTIDDTRSSDTAFVPHTEFSLNTP